MNNVPEVPVLLLTGYLGSGKTTLLNRILANRRGIKFAVIVNDIGEVNIDADLIQKGGVVDQQDDSLVPLQNGCICCTLKMDLVQQLQDLMALHRFDYIVIEASGICEPAPIAQTICSIPDMGPDYIKDGFLRLDCIASVVDALRLKDEFNGGQDFIHKNLEEDDIENLVIQQIEFCNKILLNKASEVEPAELERIIQVLRALQPKAEIIPCDYCDVSLDLLVNTRLFDFDQVATSAAWIAEIEKPMEEEEHHHHDDDDDDDEHEHEHHHHHHEEEDEHEHHHHRHHDDDDEHEHHHHHDEEEHEHHHHGADCHCHHCQHHHDHDHAHGEEYGIGTFVYYARRPFNLGRFDEFVARLWPTSVIRCKGMCYFRDEQDICYVFEQAGKQVSLRNAGRWYATMPQEELEQFLDQNPRAAQDWDEYYGDRMQKLVFIGQHMNEEDIKLALDACLCD